MDVLLGFMIFIGIVMFAAIAVGTVAAEYDIARDVFFKGK